jgi:hypothetical protein
MQVINYPNLRQILEAGREEDSLDKRITYLEQYNHAVTGEQMQVIQDRISALEERVTKELQNYHFANKELQERLSTLEQDFNEAYEHNVDLHKEIPAQPCPTECEERCPVTNVYKYCCTHCNPSPHTCYLGAGSEKCSECNPDNPKSEPKDEMIRISRKVAEDIQSQWINDKFLSCGSVDSFMDELRNALNLKEKERK